MRFIDTLEPRRLCARPDLIADFTDAALLDRTPDLYQPQQHELARVAVTTKGKPPKVPYRVRSFNSAGKSAWATVTATVPKK